MLTPIKAQINPKEVSQTLLKNVENKRVREVLEKRFGLKTGRRLTLEAIGKEYGITRERVRQIEADGLKALARPAVYGLAESVFKAIEEHLNEHGGVAAEHHLLTSLARETERPHAEFLLTVGKPFRKKQETDISHPSWYTSEEAHRTVLRVLQSVVDELEERKSPVSREALLDLIASHASKELKSRPKEQVVSTMLGMARGIGENPYGEYGLVSWSTIRPKGVRDKAYLVLQKAGKPMHFRAVADAINRMKWMKRPAHPQTVHNELIKSGDRFVLVGRGLYALREWGYMPGTVAEVVKHVLEEAGEPLARDEVVKRVMDRRFVKENTILLNLQNKDLFQRHSDGKYFVV